MDEERKVYLVWAYNKNTPPELALRGVYADEDVAYETMELWLNKTTVFDVIRVEELWLRT